MSEPVPPDPSAETHPHNSPADDPAPPAVVRLGRHEVLGEVGRGGMGCVPRARDPDFGRDLALKVLLASPGEHPDLEARFLAEARLSGRLQHPGIVPVHEVGTDPDGRPYFAM